MLEQWLTSILRHMETDPGYLDTLPQLPQVILKNEASSRFWRGEAFSHALEILCGRSEGRGRSLTPFLRMIAWTATPCRSFWNAPSKNSLKAIASNS